MGMSVKHLGLWAGLTALLWLIAQNGGNWLWLTVWLVLSGPVYALSVYLHPQRNCWSCRGTGRHAGALFGYARRPCRSCQGTGTKQRLGARVLNRDG